MNIEVKFDSMGGDDGWHVYEDTQNSSNEGTVIDLGFAPSFLYACAFKNNYADTYIYVNDGTHNYEHYVRVGGGLDDVISSIWWSSDHKQFRFHGAGATSGVQYQIYAKE